MAKKIFITGTGTDIGKTYVTGLILKTQAKRSQCSLLQGGDERQPA